MKTPNTFISELLNFSSKIEISYIWKEFEGREYFYHKIQIAEVNGIIWQNFSNHVRKIVKDCLNEVKNTVKEIEENEQMSFLEELREEISELKCIVDKEIFTFKSMWGEDESYTFLLFCNPKWVCQNEEIKKIENREVKEYLSKDNLEDINYFAELWLTIIEETKQKVDFLINHLDFLPTKQIVTTQVEIKEPFVSEQRIGELKTIKSANFDLLKLIKLCEEINIAYNLEMYYSVAMLTRAIIDHIPPILGKTTFNEVASNYAGGGKSFKDNMNNLNNSLRKIADASIHVMIRNKETLPNKVQVNFSRDIDVLLAEIYRVLK